MGAMLLRRHCGRLRAGLDPEEDGGTICWVRGLMVICHGNASRKAIANALRFGADALRGGVLEAVDEEIEKILGPSDSAASDRRWIQCRGVRKRTCRHYCRVRSPR